MDNKVTNISQLEVGKSYRVGGSVFARDLQGGFTGKVISTTESGVIVEANKGKVQHLSQENLDAHTLWVHLPEPEQETVVTKAVQDIEIGEFVTHESEAGKVYVRGAYSRVHRGYALHDQEDSSRAVFVKRGTQLSIHSGQ